jgi:hypothetical protein
MPRSRWGRDRNCTVSSFNTPNGTHKGGRLTAPRTGHTPGVHSRARPHRNASASFLLLAPTDETKPNADEKGVLANLDALPGVVRRVPVTPVLDRPEVLTFSIGELPRHVTETICLDPRDLDDRDEPSTDPPAGTHRRILNTETSIRSGALRPQFCRRFGRVLSGAPRS